MAIEAQLADGRILEFPDGTDPSVIQATVKRVIASSQPTTFGGNIKELGKGLAPGAINFLESAATGASALLPEEAEKAVRTKAKSIAEAARAPMAAAPGYEDSIGRKLGEALGSVAPVLGMAALGPLGLAAAGATGIGAGAGAARTRAEQEGATAEQRSTATLLGAGVGATELLPISRILNRVGKPAAEGMLAAVKRAAAAGGEEAAQEAASEIAQNLIAKGIYKPGQEILEGSGEAAAYGGATGAIVQGLLDAALGRRAVKPGAAPKPGQPTEAEQRLQAQKEQEAAARADALAKQEEAKNIKDAQIRRFEGDQGVLFGAKETPKPMTPEKSLEVVTPEGVKSSVLQRAEPEVAPSTEEDRNVALGINKKEIPRPEFTREEATAAGNIELPLDKARDEQDLIQERGALQFELESLKDQRNTKAEEEKAKLRLRIEELDQELIRIEDERGPQLEARGPRQGKLFEVEPPAAAPQQTQEVAPAEAAVPEGQLDLGIDAQKDYAELVQERERIRAIPFAERSPELRAYLNKLNQDIKDRILFDLDTAQQKRAQEIKAEEGLIREEELAAQSAFAQPVEGAPVPEPTLRQAPTLQTYPTQLDAGLRSLLGIGPSANLFKPEGGIVGKDISDPAQAAQVKNTLEQYLERPTLSPNIVERIGQFLQRPEFQGVESGQKQPAAQTTPPTTAPSEPKQVAKPRGGKPSVAVSGEPAGAQPAGPGAGTATPTKESGKPVGRGLVSTEQPAGEGADVGKSKPASLGTDRQQRIAFGKAIGAAQSYPGSLKGRVNKSAQSAAKQGDFQGVLNALAASKNPVIARIAALAKSLSTKIVIDDEATERYEGRSEFMDQMSIDGAKMHLEALDKLRALEPQVDALPDGAPLPFAISNESVTAIDKGEELGLPLRLKNIVENNNSMFGPLGLPEKRKFSTKEDFKALLNAFENLTADIGEDALRMTSTATSMRLGVAGAYDADTDTIRVPEYFAKDEAVLAHEVVHAQTVKAIANPTLAQRPAVQRLNKLYEHVKKVMEARAKAEPMQFREPYGIASIQEFMAEGLSNPAFQYELSRIEYQNSTAWDKFTEAVANILGIKNDNALTELLTVYGELAPAKEAAAKPKAAKETPKKEAPETRKAGMTANEAKPINKAMEKLDDLKLDPDTTKAKAVNFAKKLHKDGLIDDASMDAVNDMAKDRDMGPEDVLDEVDLALQYAKEAEGKARKSVQVTNGKRQQSLSELQSEINEGKGLLAGMLRRLVKSGKVTLADISPNGDATVGGLYNGQYVTLYAAGIRKGEAVAVALHEVGAHLGLKKLLGEKQYKEIADRIVAMASSKTASPERALAQRALARIPKEDVARGKEVVQDEAIAYFAEELAKAELNGELAKTGPLRVMYNRIRAALQASVNRVFGTGFGVDTLTPDQIGFLIKGAMGVEAFIDTKAGSQTPTENKLGDQDRFSKTMNSMPDQDVEYVNNLIFASPLPPEQGRSMVSQAFKGMESARKDVGLVAWLRQGGVDKYATVLAKTSEYFSQGVRDSFGNLNPEVLIRQSEDHPKVLVEALHRGGVGVDKDGMIVVTKADESMVTVYTKIKKFGETKGMEPQTAKEYVSKVLEGHRLYALEKQGKKSTLTREQLQKLEDIFQGSKEIQSILKDMNAIRFRFIDLMVATGRISKEQGEFWKSNADYVPFNRVFDEDKDGKPFVLRGKGLAVLRNIPQIEGSLSRPVENVVDAFGERLGYMLEESMRNQAAVKTLEVMRLAGYATKVAAPEAAENRTLVVPRLYMDGKPVHYEVQNKYDLLAFQQAGETTSSIVKAMESVSRVLRLSITAMPPFAAKQVLDDAQRAMFFSGVERPVAVAVRTLYNFPRIFFGELRGKKAPVVQRMAAYGIEGDYDSNLIRPTKDLEYELGFAKRGYGESVIHFLEKITKASDLAARAAVFEETMRETGGMEKGDVVLAQTRARELINFSRKGSSSAMRTATKVIPFFNAYAQGMDVLYRAASGIDSSSAKERSAARKMFYSRMGVMAALGFAYAFAMYDDDDYKNTTTEVRDNNWVLPGGYKLPVPKELGFLFKSIPERIVEYVRRYGTDEEQAAQEAFASLFKGALATYTGPTAVPSTVKPFLEHMANYSFFLQRELVPSSMKEREAAYQYTSDTSELAKYVGKQANVSPIVVDNYLRGLFGMAASTTLMMTDAVLNPTRPDRPLYQLPFVSIVRYDPIGGRSKAEFYELREKTTKAKNTYNKLLETDPAAADEYAQKNYALIEAASDVNMILNELNSLRKERELLAQGSDEVVGMTSTERREMIDVIRKEENAVLADIRKLKKMVRDAQE